MDFSLNVILSPRFEREGEGAVKLGLPEGDIAEKIKNDDSTGNFRKILNRFFERENVSLCGGPSRGRKVNNSVPHVGENWNNF
jgi:hypothetical protein